MVRTIYKCIIATFFNLAYLLIRSIYSSNGLPDRFAVCYCEWTVQNNQEQIWNAVFLPQILPKPTVDENLGTVTIVIQIF